jgi:hypothetical protein
MLYYEENGKKNFRNFIVGNYSFLAFATALHDGAENGYEYATDIE